MIILLFQRITKRIFAAVKAQRGASSSEYATLIALGMVVVLPTLNFVEESTSSVFSRAGSIAEGSGGPRKRDFGKTPNFAHAPAQGGTNSQNAAEGTATGTANADSSDGLVFGGGTHGTIKNADDASAGPGNGNQNGGNSGVEPFSPLR